MRLTNLKPKANEFEFESLSVDSMHIMAGKNVFEKLLPLFRINDRLALADGSAEAWVDETYVTLENDWMLEPNEYFIEYQMTAESVTMELENAEI